MKKVIAVVVLLVLLLAIGIGVLWRHRTRGDESRSRNSATRLRVDVVGKFFVGVLAGDDQSGGDLIVAVNPTISPRTATVRN